MPTSLLHETPAPRAEAASSHQVHLPGARVTARARPAAGSLRPALGCELVLTGDGDLVFALGTLDGDRPRTLRTGALAGDHPAELLHRLGRDGGGPLTALIGRLTHAAGRDRRLDWAAERTGPPLLLPAADPVGAAPGGVRLAAGTLVAALVGVGSTAQRGLVRAQATSADETCAGLLESARRHTAGPLAALTVVLDAEPAAPGALRGLHDTASGLPGPLLAYDRLRQATVALGRETSGVVLLAVLLPRHARRGPVLQETGRRMARALRPGDTVAQWQDDVLVAVCAQVTDLQDAHRLTERARASLGLAADAPQVAAIVVWDPLPDEELSLLPERAAWMARTSGHRTAVLEVSAS